MRKKILIVDDEPMLVSALVDKFTKEGFEVLTSGNGEEGLKSAVKNHPDVILLDIIMPVMDGLTMLDSLRKDSWGKSAKVIILTNLSDVEKETQLLMRNVKDYLVKSDWKISDVVSQVRKKLS